MKFIRNILVAASLTTLCACSDSGATAPTIAVSVEPQRYLLEQLTGDKFKVVTLMKQGANPETFEPTMKSRMALDCASAYFYVGGLPFEHALLQSATDIMVLESTSGIVPLYGTHSHHHHDDEECSHEESGEEADPHMWTSVKNAKVMADNMARGLIALDPADSCMYKSRLQSLMARLDSLDSSIASRLEQSNATCFMVWHPSLGYFARDYGLEQLSVGWESKEPSASALRRAIDQARSHGAKVFFYQREFDTRQTQAMTSQLGLRTVTIDPLSYDWQHQMNIITDELVK